MRKRLQRATRAVTNWFLAPEPNAAGNLGLFRIVFCLFYLWHLSAIVGADFSGLPNWIRIRILLVQLIPLDLVTPRYLSVLESLVVAAIVLLGFGYRTRVATAAVLVLGSFLEAHFMTYRTERGGTLMVFFIPFFMFIANTWGKTYSVDAMLERRAGRPVSDPHDPGGVHYYPAKAVLVVLVALFVSAAAAKIGPGTTWLVRPHMLGDQMLMNNLNGAIHGVPTTPLPAFLAHHDNVEIALRYFVIFAEASVLVMLMGRAWRQLMIPILILFHAVNAIAFIVTFTPIVIVYGLFVNWQGLRDRLLPERIAFLERIPSPALIAIPFVCASALALTWDYGTLTRGLFSLGGLIDWRTIFIPLTIVALVSLPLALARVLSPQQRKQ